MPAIMPREDYSLWLDPELASSDKVVGLLRPYPAEEMRLYPVGTAVSNPRVEGAGLVEPVTA
jgi:putative SOS response-associated peptidase YedK